MKRNLGALASWSPLVSRLSALCDANIDSRPNSAVKSRLWEPGPGLACVAAPICRNGTDPKRYLIDIAGDPPDSNQGPSAEKAMRKPFSLNGR
jgi:hypothetical protein